LAVVFLMPVTCAGLQGVAGAAVHPAALPTGRWEVFASGDDILCLAREGDLLWAGTRAGGLIRWDTGDGSHVQYLRPQDPLGGNTINGIAVDADGRKWLATDNGLTMFDDAGTPERADDTWRTYTRENTQGGLPSDDVRAVAVDGELVWVGAAQVWNHDTEGWEGGGFGRLDTKGTPATADDTWMPPATYANTVKRGPDGSRRLGLVSDNVTALVVTADRKLWVATGPQWLFEKPPVPELEARWGRRHGGISHVDTRGTTDPTDDVWTANDCEAFQVTVTCQVQAMALDPHGNVWAAIGGRGVMYFPVGSPQIIDERSRRFELDGGAEDDFVEALAFGPADDARLANTVWMGRRKGGLSVLDHRGTLRQRGDDVWDFDRGGPLTAADGLGVDRVQALSVFGSRAWIGTGAERGTGGGLLHWWPEDGPASGPWRVTGAPPTNFVTAIAFGQPGTRWQDHVWLATGSRAQRLFGAGMVDLDTAGTRSRHDDTWTHHTAAGTDADGAAPWTGLAGDNVHAVLADGERVWFGSTESTWDQGRRAYADGGLSVFDGEQWTARTVATSGGADGGPLSGSVSSLAAGCKGELWVGTGNAWDYWGGGVNELTPGASVHDRSGDRWVRHRHPALASNNTTGIAVNCSELRAWVSAEHHVTQGEPPGMAGAGNLVGGGMAVRDMTAGTWTRFGKREGFESYARSFIDGEATTVTLGPDGTVWAGAYGTRAMETSQLVSMRPFYPAVLNARAFGAGAWANHVFRGAGYVSSVAVDGDGRVWAATSRGGAARDSGRPENWRVDRDRGGLMVLDDGAWLRLDTANSGLPSNDLSVVAVAPNGDVWVASEGWGVARYMVGEAAPTPTATSDAPTPTASPTPPVTPGTAEPTPTSDGTATGQPRPTLAPGANELFLPLVARPSRGVVRATLWLPLVERGRR